ncbi:MAG TPA: vitamin K epoxide reductase family protein [Vicinamibacterales bacterium]|nr:vitamin K epoxide reductase family protein [Vicinamibacterales bacterium]
MLPLVVAAVAGLGFAAASAWVHYRILNDPLYSSICDVNATFSCTEAYTSRYGVVGGVPVALIGVLFFSFILLVIALCQRSTVARNNLPGYVFAISTVGLAGVLYLAYASFFVLQAVCLLCVGTYAAIIALFLISGAAARYPMSTLPNRASSDMRRLVRTPAALGAALAFAAAAVVAVMLFPAHNVSASTDATAAVAGSTAAPAPVAGPPVSQSGIQQLEQYLEAQTRVPIVAAGGSGATVIIIKFNDYLCPPCGQTFREYKPIIAKLQKLHPGKIAYLTRDFPLDPECNSLGGSHAAACEAAVAVRLAREKGKGDAMEDWLFTNQATLTPTTVRQGVATVGGVTDFDARYPKTLEFVKGDVKQGLQLSVRGTPTFFLNGIRLPNLRGEFFEAAVNWELRKVAAAAK